MHAKDAVASVSGVRVKADANTDVASHLLIQKTPADAPLLGRRRG